MRTEPLEGLREPFGKNGATVVPRRSQNPPLQTANPHAREPRVMAPDNNVSNEDRLKSSRHRSRRREEAESWESEPALPSHLGEFGEPGLTWSGGLFKWMAYEWHLESSTIGEFQIRPGRGRLGWPYCIARHESF